MDPLVGTLIDGRYRIDERIADGGFGVVYRAHHLGLGSPIAVKVLKLPELDHDRRLTLTAAFLDEGRTLKLLRHPNIVAALDIGVLDDRETPYLVMEWCDGPTLKRHVEQRGPMSIAEAWKLFEPILQAMAHAHASNIAHRDLKTANILLDAAGAPRVVDFGIAKILAPEETAGSGETHTASGRSAFTPRYAAPEQLAGARTGPWTDVHALGLIFVELVAGRSAIGEGDARLAVVDPVRPTPRALGVDVGALEPVLARAMALRPSDRFANADELARAMRAAIHRRRSWLAPVAVGAAVLLVAGTAGAIKILRGSPQATIAPVAISAPEPPAASIVVDASGPRLRSLALAEAQRRFETQKIGSHCAGPSENPGSFFIVCEDLHVSGIHWALPGLSTTGAIFAHASDMGLANLSAGQKAMVAVDGDFALTVVASAKDVERVFEAIVLTDAVEKKGFAEPVPTGMSAGARTSLAKWSGIDLVVAARNNNLPITHQAAAANPATVTVGSGNQTATLRLYVGDVSKSLASAKKESDMKFVYASAPDHLLTVTSFVPKWATEDFVAQLLNGARADAFGTIAAR